MTHKTKGIILRTVKYGETSLVVTAFTELFGIQAYMVNKLVVFIQKCAERCGKKQRGHVHDGITL
jgi:DNA repair protein RecO (recombination protein O)